MKIFEQLDDLMDDDIHPVSRHDPMFSSLDSDLSSSSPKLSRCSSTESTEDSDSMSYQQKKLQHKEKKKVKRHHTANKPIPELYNTPRMPVVSRPYHFKPRFNISLPVLIPKASSTELHSSNTSSMVFPLQVQQGLSQLANLVVMSENEKAGQSRAAKEIVPSNGRSSVQLSRSLSSSSEDEQLFSNKFDNKFESEAKALSPSPPPRPLSVIRKTASVLQSKVEAGKNCEELDEAKMSDKSCKRKVILQERAS